MNFKTIVILTIFIILSHFGFSQSVFDNVDTVKYPYRLWDSVVVSSCNTAANAEYMTIEERNIIWLHNLVRFDGDLFARTFLLEYIEENGIQSTYYIDSLFVQLKIKAFKLPLLKPSEHIYQLAYNFAIYSGNRGSEGHKWFSYRARKSGHSRFSENTEYGDSTAIDIFMSLLIDEDFESLGHRNNILDLHAKKIGVSIQHHTKYNFICVIDYGG